ARHGGTARRPAVPLPPPFVEQAAFLDLALHLVLLQRALPLEIQPPLHLAVAAGLGLRALLLLHRLVDDLVADRAAEKRAADDRGRPALAAADERAESAAGRCPAECSERRLGRLAAAFFRASCRHQGGETGSH